MRVAVVGSGISGLTVAYRLTQAGHEVFVFEAGDYVGGHTHTIDVDGIPVDTGFIVFNEHTYPHFIALLAELNVETQDTDMSFSVYDPAIDFQYAGGSLNGVFADRRHLVDLSFYRLLYDINRFNRLAAASLHDDDTTLTLGAFLKKHRFHSNLSQRYLYPLISSLWSTPPAMISEMPLRFIAHFFYNHALLKLRPDIAWKVIKHGSVSYVNALLKTLINPVQLNTPVTRVVQTHTNCQVFNDSGLLGEFDRVVLATHSVDALRIIDKPTDLMQAILSAFPYQDNDVILHQDSRLLPSNPRAWASWNYLLTQDESTHAILTYNMNRLQSISETTPLYVSLNAAHLIAPEKIIQQFRYSHPQYTPQSLAAQSRQQELNNEGFIYFCGAYWGFGFHEDGVKSALAVCEQFKHA